MDLFTAIDITKKFSNHTALDKVSVTIPENSIFGLLGPNGAGKTTLIRIMNRIIAQDEGELYFSGRKLMPRKSARTALSGAAIKRMGGTAWPCTRWGNSMKRG